MGMKRHATGKFQPRMHKKSCERIKGGIMMWKRSILSVLAYLAVCLSALSCQAAGSGSLSITGTVKYPINLNTSDLTRFQTVNLQSNEIDTSGEFYGVFNTQGVPLRHLLEICQIEKEETGFRKPVDLAIVVTNASGKQVVLSWGEVFYKDPANVAIVFSATPVVPHLGAADAYAKKLNRTVHYPKLVIAGDRYSDRFLEGIVNIDVKSLKNNSPSRKMQKLYSPDFTIVSPSGGKMVVNDLSPYHRTEISAAIVGEGKGFRGVKSFRGVPLIDLLNKAGVKPDMNNAVLVSAPDGYRSLLSYGEISLSPHGRGIIVADQQEQGKALTIDGKFLVFMPDDLFVDREVRAVEKIEVISMKKSSKLYIVGVGPGDTNLITAEAVSALGRTDALICPEDIKNRFASYLEGKEVLFDPMKIVHLYMKANRGTSPAEAKKELEEKRAEAIRKVRETIAAGKNVALLDWGDPLLYGSSKWIKGFFADDDIEVVPSISAFNVANAVIDRDMTCRGSLVISDPLALRNNESLLKTTAEHGDTMAIFMGLKELRGLMPLLNKYYKESTPIAIAYNAGIEHAEHVIRSTLKDVLSQTESEQEKHLGMIYIGSCLGSRNP